MLATAAKDYKLSHGFDYPLLFLLNQQRNKLNKSSPPQRWTINHRSFSHHPIKKTSWEIGRILEECIANALEAIGFSEKDSPENLSQKEFYQNCCYKNNGYGADFIGRNFWIEAKYRNKYLDQLDFYRNALPRFLDLDEQNTSQQDMMEILVVWGKVSKKTICYIKKHGVFLIVIPFSTPGEGVSLKDLQQLATAYIAERLKETMIMFTICQHDCIFEDCVNDDDYYSYMYQLYHSLTEDDNTYYFDPSSTNFYPNTEPLNRCRQNQMEVYYQMVTPVPPWTIRWLNQLEVFKQIQHEE